jgi:hypothetical protein
MITQMVRFRVLYTYANDSYWELGMYDHFIITLLYTLSTLDGANSFIEDTLGAQPHVAGIKISFLRNLWGDRQGGVQQILSEFCLEVKANHCSLQCVLITNPTGIPCLIIKS